MSLLNKEKADALCSIITLGFCALERKKTITFQYPSQKGNDTFHVKKLFLEKGVSVSVSESRNKKILPLIIAKSNRIKTVEDILEDFSDNEKKVARDLERSANSKDNTYYGAYIGGLGTEGVIHLVGASSLVIYEPRYRKVSSQIKKSFTSAKLSSQNIINLLEEKYKTGAIISGVKVTIQDLDTELPDYKEGCLFGSYHGMIKSMIKYYTDINPNAYIFEIACSKNTSKVSSCFPCTLFMVAQDKPPTSIHLGRGDNWKIPTNCPKNFMDNWKALVIKSYKKGLTYNVPYWDEAFFPSDNIPDVFLESLTFEGSFTGKIINTLATK